jgi:hypothetical protein
MNVGYRLDRVLLEEDDCHAAQSKRFGGVPKNRYLTDALKQQRPEDIRTMRGEGWPFHAGGFLRLFLLGN